MPTRGAKKSDDNEAEEATDDAGAIDEVHMKVQEAILLVRGLATNTSRALAAALVAAGINDDDMLREVSAEDVKQVMDNLAVYKDGAYPLLLPKNIAVKLHACVADGGSPPRRSPPTSARTASSQHTTTSAAVAISSIKPTARLAEDGDSNRPGLARSEEFSYVHIKPYVPYDPRLLQAHEELRTNWDMTKEAAANIDFDIDTLVKQSLAPYLTRNMGATVYSTYIKPHLTKEERECPIMIIWQLLSEARKVSELALSKRYSALLQPQRATTIAGLTAQYQQQVDEETELRLHEFVTDRKSHHLKEAYLVMCSNYPVLLTKIEIAWQASISSPVEALTMVRAEIVTYFSTQPEARSSKPLPSNAPATASTPPVAPTIPPYPHRTLPSGRQMGSKLADNVCRQFKARGTCTYGDSCKYKHDTASIIMLTEVQLDDEEDYVIEMFQQATMAVAEPHIAMAVMNGISGFDSE